MNNRLLSTVSTIYSTLTPSTDPKNENGGFSTSELFENVFLAKNIRNIQEARVGAFIDVDANELTKHFPEGLAGDLTDEFDFSANASWMVRDSSKILCRILDEFVVGKGKSINDIEFPKNMVSTVKLPGLTDRPEWPSAALSVRHFGKELTKPIVEEGELEVTSGAGSVVETCLSQLKESTAELPRSIILTGTALFAEQTP